MAKKVDHEALKRFVRGEGASYLDRPNVTSVGIGRKIKDGKETNELAIQFTVGRKLQPEALAAEGLQPLPESITVNGVEVPVDVLERTYKPSYKLVAVQTLQKDQRKTRLDPVKPGASVGHPKITAGTLGCVVIDQRDGSACVLSNWHVLHGPEGHIGDVVVQPGSFDDNRVTQNALGRLVRSHLGPAGDCAIARIESRGFATDDIALSVAVQQIGTPELGDQVIKSGRTTGVTRGVVRRVDVVTKLDYGGTVGQQRIGGFEIGPDPAHKPQDQVSRGGDSGAAWMAVDKGGKSTGVMLGLHFAGESDGDPDDHALACYAQSVFEKLEIGLQTPSSIQLATRQGVGYDPKFLGVVVPEPKPTRKTASDLLKLNGSTTINHTHFSLAMSVERKFCYWVAWNIDGGSLKSLSRKGLRFQPDPLVPEDAQVGDEIYSNNRLDRGHIARRADLLWGPVEEANRANLDSFFFTNIAPQHEGFNQSKQGGLWGELEDAIFEDTEVEGLRLTVMGGPIFGDKDPEFRGVLIPREFWKVIAFIDGDGKVLTAKGYVLTQADLLNQIEALGLEPFRLFRVPLRDIESRIGFSFGDLSKSDERETIATRRRGVRRAAAVEGVLRAGVSEITSRDQIAT